MKALFKALFFTAILVLTPAALVVAVSGCSTLTALGSTPEAQIVTGANALTVATTGATVALRNDKITVTQAKNYSAILHGASSTLDTANGALLACRKASGSTSATSPDPCRTSVIADIQLALDSIASVKKTLDSK